MAIVSSPYTHMLLYQYASGGITVLPSPGLSEESVASGKMMCGDEMRGCR